MYRLRDSSADRDEAAVRVCNFAYELTVLSICFFLSPRIAEFSKRALHVGHAKCLFKKKKKKEKKNTSF